MRSGAFGARALRGAAHRALTAHRVCDARARAPAHRYAAIETLGATKRGNRLPYAPSDGIEYAVHGKFLRPDPDDVKGVDGTWWVPLKMMVKAYSKEELQPLLEQFEHELAEARAEALDAVEEGGDSDDE